MGPRERVVLKRHGNISIPSVILQCTGGVGVGGGAMVRRGGAYPCCPAAQVGVTVINLCGN